MTLNKLYHDKSRGNITPVCEHGRTDCKFYRCDDIFRGCIALNALYCRLEEKPCAFYKAKKEKKNESGFR